VSNWDLSEFEVPELPDKDRFQDFALPLPLMHAIADLEFAYCTPIQSGILPFSLADYDVTGQAQTGTGKTAAFLIAVYKHLLTHPADARRKPSQPRALVLAPTRELAIQIPADALVLGRHTGLKPVLAYGGTGYDTQREAIESGVDILIGTPGRLIDYHKQHIYDLKKIIAVVLDEADRMFDLGFIKDIRYVMRRLPPASKRLNMLFSATLSYRVLELAYEHMNDPGLVKIEAEKVTAERVRQRIFFPANNEKIPLLIGLLRKMKARRTMVFVNTKREADRLAAYLNANGVQAEAMSGDVPQRKRLRMLRDFQSGDLPVLIGTDVASRGLHIPDVEYVINYDLPQDAEDYVHRIGRTARAGAEGDAISFGCENYVMSLPEIESFIGMRLPVEPVEPELLVDPVVRPPRRERRSDGDRRPHGRKPRRNGGGDHDGGPPKRQRRRQSGPAKPAGG